jgi:hypothetical protein
MRSEPQAVPPKIKMAAPPLLGLFAGVVLGMTAIGAGAVFFSSIRVRMDFIRHVCFTN